jgi:hypothetical protein
MGVSGSVCLVRGRAGVGVFVCLHEPVFLGGCVGGRSTGVGLGSGWGEGRGQSRAVSSWLEDVSVMAVLLYGMAVYFIG